MGYHHHPASFSLMFSFMVMFWLVAFQPVEVDARRGLIQSLQPGLWLKSLSQHFLKPPQSRSGCRFNQKCDPRDPVHDNWHSKPSQTPYGTSLNPPPPRR
ncbi:unnamed protein product [Musa banksii]